MKLYVFILLSFLLFSVSSCEKKERTGVPPSSPGGVSRTSVLELYPPEATRESTFSIQSKRLDLSKAEVQWFVNDKMVEGAASSQFRLSNIKKGDTVRARVFIGDQQIVSNQIMIKNIQPAIANANIIPSNPKTNDTLKAEVVGSDRDGDSVTFFYEWSKNGEHAGSSETLEGPFKRGDKIFLKITPYDGDDYGQPTSLTTNIYNSPPKPFGGEQRFENNVYTYQVKATDPDGDSLSYTLKRAPKGMVIDKSTGLITWKVEEKDAGRHPVNVQVSDGHGGEVLYNFDVTLGFEGLIK